MQPDGYELIDAGDGRRLERFGALVVDRPSPSADEPPRDADAWAGADLRFFRYAGWEPAAEDVDPWRIELAGLTLELRATDTGQVGVFPEQAPNWQWLRRQVEARAGTDPAPRVADERDEAEAAAAVPESRGSAAPSVLNLFAYTGVATLVAAAGGASVAHVDGSRPSVAWARRNAELSGLESAPVRWLVDDAEAFVARELRRGRRYDGFVLDPPSYGHAAGRGSWRLEERLEPLLRACADIASRAPFVALTAHTPGFDGPRLAELIADTFRAQHRDIDAGDLTLSARSGARLRLGSFARWPRSAAAAGAMIRG
ncbi:MAG TPA: class I SAM-dependent methyltransferase [Candidatus Limnocylindrales bacterium]